MRTRMLAILLVVPHVLFAEKAQHLTVDFEPFHRSKDGSVYRLLVTNASEQPILLAAVARGFGKTISWDRTDTYYSSGMDSRPGWIYPATYAEITGKDGKTLPYGGEAIRKAIRHPTGDENSFCTIQPGMNISCEDPVLNRKPDRAVFHFLERRGEKTTPIEVAWHAGQPCIPTWEAATDHPIPNAKASRTRLYEVPFAVFGIREPDLPIVQSRGRSSI